MLLLGTWQARVNPAYKHTICLNRLCHVLASLLGVCLLFMLPLKTVWASTHQRIRIGDFSAGNAALVQWQPQYFAGTTHYQIVSLDNIFVLRAISHASASGLVKQYTVDLWQTPFLNWRWRIQQPFAKTNEQSKAGDDYNVRIYVVIDGGWLFWNTKAINYVWSSSAPKGSQWANAYAGDNAMMMAIRSRNDESGRWYQEKRNIMEDFKTLHGIDIRYIHAVALMTDTDNTQGNATAYYGDIYFSAQ